MKAGILSAFTHDRTPRPGTQLLVGLQGIFVNKCQSWGHLLTDSWSYSPRVFPKGTYEFARVCGTVFRLKHRYVCLQTR